MEKLDKICDSSMTMPLARNVEGRTPGDMFREQRRQIRGFRDATGTILRRGLRKAWEEAETISTRFHDLFEFAPIGYLSLDRRGNILQVNRVAKILLEKCSACLEGSFGFCLVETDRETFRGFLDKIFTTKTKQVRTVELQQDDGTRVFVRLEAALPRKSDQECFVVMVEETRTRDRLLSTLLYSSTAVWTKDRDGRVTDLNQQGEALLGFSKECQMGKTIASLFPPEIAEPIMASDLKVMETGVPVLVEEVIRRNDGDHWVVSSKCPLRNEDGEINGLCVISMDLAEVTWAKEGMNRIFADLERLLSERTEELKRYQELVSRIF